MIVSYLPVHMVHEQMNVAMPCVCQKQVIRVSARNVCVGGPKGREVRGRRKNLIFEILVIKLTHFNIHV